MCSNGHETFLGIVRSPHISCNCHLAFELLREVTNFQFLWFIDLHNVPFDNISWNHFKTWLQTVNKSSKTNMINNRKWIFVQYNCYCKLIAWQLLIKNMIMQFLFAIIFLLLSRSNICLMTWLGLLAHLLRWSCKLLVPWVLSVL